LTSLHKRNSEVNVKKLFIAALIAALPAASEFAQSSPAPANQSALA
jgi:hypothetical protein